MALAGIDMALWDAEARRREAPLQRLLGASGEGCVRVYAGVGFDGESESARQAERWAALGHQGVKAKIGYPTLAEDLAVVRAMRAAVGPDVELMVDYNQSLDGSTAFERLRALDDEGLAWIEEPVAAHEHALSARVRAAARTPLQSGENWWGPTEFEQAIAAGASDHVMPDVMKVGGVTGWRRAATLAEAHGLPVSSHLWPELSARLLVCGTTGHRVEYTNWWNPVLQAPLVVEEGVAVPDPDAPGSGIEWDETAVERYRV